MGMDPQSPETLLGRVIARYELTEFIGSGATGLVYRGRLTEAPIEERTGLAPLLLPEEAAIKLLVPPVGSSPKELKEFRSRFEREARILSELNHPHILRVLAYGDDAGSGMSYMILPYMAGGSLAKVIAERGPLPLPEVSRILTTIADALDYAHRHNVVHRDVKPGNILLDAAGIPALGDFSIVRQLSEGASLRTSTGRMMGTPAYMSPEQFDDSSKAGPAADIYSLGMVAYEMVTGHTAFSSTSWVQALRQHLQETPPLPQTLRPDLSAPDQAAIMRAVEKDPAQRFPTASAFAEAFALGLDGIYANGLTRFASLSERPTEEESGARTQIISHADTADPSTRLAAASVGRTRLGVLGGAVALLVIISCVLGALFLGSGGPLHAFFGGRSTPTSKPLAQTTATHAAAATATSGHTTSDPASHPTATPKPKSNTSGGGGPVSAPTNTPVVIIAPPTVTPTPTPTPRPPTPTPVPQHFETTGPNGSGTFTNYTNAGGYVGQSLAGYQTVQVSCRVQGWQRSGSPAGDNWWYRLVPSPWNNNYYAYADNFYNNGQTSGPINNGVLVDASVPLC